MPTMTVTLETVRSKFLKKYGTVAAVLARLDAMEQDPTFTEHDGAQLIRDLRTSLQAQ